MNRILPLITLLLPALALGADDSQKNWPGSILSTAPRLPVVGERKLASQMQEKKEANKAVFEQAKPGDVFILQNSIQGWNNEVVSVVDKFSDGTIRVKLENGSLAVIRGSNLAEMLSPEVSCGDSHGVQICKGDSVFYPVRTSSLLLPEGPVAKVFKNGTVVVKDGADFYLDLDQVGKSVNCSPQKESICTGDYVLADAYKDTEKFSFEGPVEKVYTNGIAIVKVDNNWRYPIQATALVKRVASLDGASNPAVITSREGFTKKAQPIQSPISRTQEIVPGSIDVENPAPDVK